MHWGWDYWKEIGIMSWADYPYVEYQTSCQTPSPDEDSTLDHVHSHGNLYGGTTSDMRRQLEQGPLTVVVSAGNDCWRFYGGGIMTEDMECPKSIDHAVVLTGYHVEPGAPILSCS